MSQVPKVRSDSRLVILAPVTGCVVPLERVPDPVFAERMVGDGVAIDPLESQLVAPSDGRIVQLHPAGHALTLAVGGHVEVMMHIGLDTVQLAGRGFTPRVTTGAEVRAGQTLIDFDPDFIATHARSLLTQVVITAGAKVAGAPAEGIVRAGMDAILELVVDAPSGGSVPAAADVPRVMTSAPIVVTNASGLHARPAAVLASRAKKFVADLRLERGSRVANAKSVVALMGLEVNQGDTVRVAASGPDAADAVRTLEALIGAGLGEREAPPVRRPASGPEPPDVPSFFPSVPSGAGDPGALHGVPASPGVVAGTVVQVRHDAVEVVEHAREAQRERKQLEMALEHARAELEALQVRLEKEADPGKAAIFAAHQELLDDPDLIDATDRGIAEGKSAAFAWQRAFMRHADHLAGLRNELLAARANDLRDVGGRVLRLLVGASVTAVGYPANAILVASDLTPSDTATLDRSKVVGFCTVAGGATSHVAILARSLGLPAIAGIDPRALDLATGTPVILDGHGGALRANPTVEDLARVRTLQQQQAARREADLAQARQPACTRDGHRVEVAANIGSRADAEQAVGLGAEAVGLLRSEFLFLGRGSAPSEDEQAEAYEAIARVLGPERPLVIRLLDVGGDKPLGYLPVPREDNPFLGERGVRLLLNRPDLLRSQVRAALRASRAGAVRVMVPMIATLTEWRAVRAIFEEERVRLGVPAVPLGMMVEVPSAAILASQFALEVDFFSVGTNDLTQYALAMDRGHPKLAAQVDGLEPAVLQLIALTVEAAHHRGKWVGVCGGIAGDEQAVPVLIGLGVDELSVAVPAVPAIKGLVRSCSRAECAELARRALRSSTAADVRGLVPAATTA